MKACRRERRPDISALPPELASKIREHLATLASVLIIESLGEYQLSQWPPTNFAFPHNGKIALQVIAVCLQKGLREVGFN